MAQRPPERPWSPRTTAALWGTVVRAAREGLGIAETRARVREAGIRPDAATLSFLYSRAVRGAATARAEEAYRGRVDRGTYLARRPGGEHVGRLPPGFTPARRWLQVVRAEVRDPLGIPQTRYVSISTDRLLSRGEAIDLAGELLRDAEVYGTLTIDELEYDLTWGAE